LAKAKAKVAVKRSPAKAPTRATAAPKSAATKSAAPKSAAPKSAKASVAKAGAAKTVKSVVTKPVAKAAIAAKPTVGVKTAVAVKPMTKPDVAPLPRVTQQLGLPAAKQVEAPVAKPQPVVRKLVEATVGRADLPPADGFTLLVDGHFKNNYDDLKGAKAAASELKGRFPMLRVEIYDAAKKARLPA
jgi:hypothetical protein